MWTFLLAGILAWTGGETSAQRRGAGGSAALAINVTDPAGAGIPDVLVTVSGAAQRTTRTEGGRIAVENIPAGTYQLRFEREGFVTLERELTVRSGKPTAVKVTLKPLPPPPAPPAEPPKPSITAKPMAADLPALIENDFIGRAPLRESALACGAGGSSTLVQLNQPLAEHTHADADEFFYVVAGEGSAQVGTGQQRLKAGIFLFVPRGMSHALTPAGRNPLIVMSTRAGEPCRQ